MGLILIIGVLPVTESGVPQLITVTLITSPFGFVILNRWFGAIYGQLTSELVLSVIDQSVPSNETPSTVVPASIKFVLFGPRCSTVDCKGIARFAVSVSKINGFNPLAS